MTKQASSIVKAMLEFFGMSTTELIREWKALTDDEKAFFALELRKEGYDFPATEGKPY